jgi:hypothetical protein
VEGMKRKFHDGALTSTSNRDEEGEKTGEETEGKNLNVYVGLLFV